jgi:hypothetical protein
MQPSELPMPELKESDDSLPYRPVPLAELETAARDSSKVLPYLLALKLNYDVKQGGFSQLLHNMQGNFLADMEDMLVAANAPVAHAYYIRAVTVCLENKKEYFRFLESNYTDANDVKHSLQMLSVEYLQKRIDFANEAAAFLATCPRL